MTTLSTARTTSPQRPNRARWTIPARLRKSILVTHAVSAGAWIGIDVVSVVLVAIGWVRAGDDRTAAYRALAPVARGDRRRRADRSPRRPAADTAHQAHRTGGGTSRGRASVLPVLRLPLRLDGERLHLEVHAPADGAGLLTDQFDPLS